MAGLRAAAITLLGARRQQGILPSQQSVFRPAQNVVVRPPVQGPPVQGPPVQGRFPPGLVPVQGHRLARLPPLRVGPTGPLLAAACAQAAPWGQSPPEHQLANELALFHGAPIQAINSIARSGFSLGFSNSQGALGEGCALSSRTASQD